MQGVAEPC
ncbi:hypothetical protein LQQ90_16905 [Escherichia coli]|nr:hypothetical protein [Escherichia coli]MCE7703030.1 hypothetical protein [Escherichia coli]MCI3536466.1 hypothetical protein [Escherichia coli]MCJ7964272.1 hypothetical protein [Escherichia coli]MCL4038926.1 hypothetical protein [Escherichia coli]MCM2777188.1 hypothetical protein [Escherichia coli]